MSMAAVEQKWSWPTTSLANIVDIHLTRPLEPWYWFRVKGEPVAKERPRVFRRHTITPKKTKHAEERLGWSFRATFPNTECDDAHLWGVRIIFHCERPGQRDGDNCLKLCLDALSGLLWQNDRQVREYMLRVVRAQPGEANTEIFAYHLADG